MLARRISDTRCCWLENKEKKNSLGDVAMALTMSGWVNSGRERKNALLVPANWIRNNDKTKCKLNEKQ